MYIITLIAATLAGLAAAVPARHAETDFFTMISIHSTSVVQGSSINVNGQRFWINKPTSSYCLEGVDCPAITVNNPTGTAGMDVAVLGGQQAYAAPDGALAYIIAHSASIPNDSTTATFEYTPQRSAGTVGELTLNGYSFYACPSDTENVYQIYADSPGFTRTDCIDIVVATASYEGSAAWEYA